MTTLLAELTTLARLHLGEPAIDEQLGAGDVARVVGGQEHGRLGNFVRVAHAPERHLGAQGLLDPVPLLRAVAEPVPTRRLNRPRADRVDADPPGLEVRGPGPGEG